LRGDDVFCVVMRGNTSTAECIAHELGHNSGLAHGGLIGPPSAALFDHTNNSPNFYSIMNYSYSYGGVPTGCTAPTWSLSPRWGWFQDPAGGPATFSEGIRMPLVEANINENTGVCDNIPWDLNKPGVLRSSARGDGRLTIGPLDVVDARHELINESQLVCCWRWVTVAGTRATARDYDQWGNMILDFRTCWTENKGTVRRPRC
jgi:hypothetical protein